MKIKQVLALLFVVTFSLSSWADRISPEDAAAIAASFVNNQPALRKAHKAPQTAASMRLAHTRQKASSTENAFYVFNRADKAGFIIVSADDRTAEDVLGYSDNGAEFNMETINPNLRWWLDRYAEEISAIDQDPEAAVQPRKARQAVTAIAPLLVNKNGVEITWYQETPYNNYCPIDQRDNTRCYTGCVATASAQIMYKWQYPAKGTGSHSYTWKDCKDDNCTQYWSKTMSSNFDTVTFNWDNMLPAYGSVNYTTAQAKAVASLMYNMGIAAEMSYGGDANGGSGAWTDVAAYGLKNFFGYEFDRFITMYSQSNYGTASVSPAEYGVSTTTITNYFNTDLEAGRPILMGGEDSNGGGHEFVCDGRDANNKFHINWGWEGDGNGYFAITALKPTGTSYNFSTNIDALIGLRPAKTYADVNVTWMANGQQFDQTVAKSGVLSLPTSTPADCVNGKEFVGWTAVADYEGDAAPEFVISGTLIEENATYYAVYATKEEGQGGGSSEESLTFSNLGLDNQADVDGQVIAIGNNSSITFSKGTGSNGPKYYNTGSAIRAYGGNTIVVEATGNMSEIVFSFASGEGSNAITADKGTYDNGTWTGDANSVTFTIGGTSGHRRIASVKVTVAGGSGVSYSDFSTSCGSAEPCVLSGLDLNTDNVQKTFVTGEAFNYDGLIVTAFYSNCNSRVVTPTTVTNPDMSVAGEKAITVRYDENGSMIYAAYTINVVDPETYTIRFINNGVQIGEAQNVVEGQSPVVPENPEACEGYEFFGWFTETFDETTNAPAKVEDFTAVKDQDYYAVFSRTEVTEGQGGGSAEVADELTVATTGVSGNTYTDWSGISVNSSAVYAGQSAGGNNAIQLRSKNSNSGIITTSSGGTITKVTVAWNSNTSGRTLDVYGSNTAYTDASDLYGNNAGTKLGSIASDTDTDLVIEGDYAFVGVRSNNSALYMDAITFTWKTEGGSGGSSSSVTYYTTNPNCEPIVPPSCALASITLNTENVQKEFTVGGTFNYEGLKVYAHYDGCDSQEVSAYTVSNPVMTTVGAQLITVTYSEEGITKTAQYEISIVDGSAPVSYTISFYSNGTLVGEPQTIEAGQEPTIPSVTAPCDGYDFFGWFTETFNETENAPAKVEDFKAVKDQDYYAVFSRTEVTEGQGGGSAEVADELTVATTGVSGNNYTDWSGISVNSSAVYAGQSAGGNDAIQLRSKNSNSGIITTSSGGTITKVTVAWNSNTSGRTLDVYGSNTAYTDASDLYGNNAGTKLGSIASDTDTDLVIEGDYAFVGVRSNNSALYMDAITFTWKTEGGSGGSSSSVTYYTTAPNCEPVEEIAVTGVALDKESVTLVVGQTATLVATVLPENATNKNITWTSDNEAVATVANGVVTAVGAGETTITVITVDGNFQAQCIVSVNAPVVKEWYTIEEVVAMFDGTLPTEEITVRGYVTKIQTAYSAQYGNISFWMDDTADGAQNRFEAYRTVPVEESDIDVAVGDYVEAKGTLTLYGSTKEFAQGGTYHILSGHETVAVEGVELDQPDAALTVGDSILLIATVLPENATNKNVTWSTSNDKVAIVEYGLVIAVGVGDAEITVTTEDGQFSATCSVIVEEPENPTYYTIRFFNNGEQIGAEQVILENSFPEVPADPTPTCENHTFVGWWTDSLGKDNTEKKDWITDFKATKDQDYHAIFSKKVQSEGQGSVTEHVTFADLGYENSAEVTIVTMDNCTLTFDKGTGTTTPKYYTSGAAVRCYKNNTLTITSDNAITGIAVTTVSGYDGVIKASEGEYSDGTWSGSTTSVTLTNAPEDNAQWRIVTIEVTTGAGSVTYYSSLEYCDESAIEAVEEAGAVAEKVLRNGQIFILRGDAVYSITGARVQ